MFDRLFHPAVSDWFGRAFGPPTPAQRAAWPVIAARRPILVVAPTGSGKTLAAFMAALDDLYRRGIDRTLADETRVVYVSPLKALSNDIQKNLQEPIAGIGAALSARGLPVPEIRVLVRTGDTPAAERAAMIRRPPHVLVTTPESLYILLTSESGRRMVRTARTLILDEIHAVADDRRGAHLALSVERLQHLASPDLLRIGLSATVRPTDVVARFLVGAGPEPDCTVIDLGHTRGADLAIEMPGSPLETVLSGDTWNEIYDRLAALARDHRTTLVFVNTRRLAERMARHLGERLGETQVAAHHGSLARDRRLVAEQRLKNGDLRVMVATASLELGIDIGTVDLVCQIGSPRSIGVFLQRIGRSGHALGRTPKGRIFPLTRDELVETIALIDAVRRRELDALVVPRGPLDILAQQIVAETASADWGEDDLFALVRRAWPYRDLPRADFDAVVRMLAEGFAIRRGRRGAWVHRDAVNGRLRGRRGARLAAITSGGAIPDTADYTVTLEPSGIVVGTVHEDFAVESMAGDVFQLGNTSWRILKIEPGTVRVEDARGQPPGIPFWIGEAPGRTAELSAAVARLRDEADRLLERPPGGDPVPPVTDHLAAVRDPQAAVRDHLAAIPGVPPAAADQAAVYLAAGRAALQAMPTQETLVLERFFDETGGMQLVVHAPFGSRVNRAWGLALRKRFCRQFNFELQAAATEDAIVLSLGPTHSFPLADVFRFLDRRTVHDVLTQALLDAPVFPVRWRWNTTRALAVPRRRAGRKMAAPLQRFLADDLLALVFPDQVACVENTGGRRDIPDHPLVRQTIDDCLEEAMDVAGLEAILARIESGAARLVARDLRGPSPFAQEVLNARPYAFLDDAPLEERRTQAVMSRGWIDPETAAGLGALDAAAIAGVREAAWPEAIDADELHDALLVHGFLTEAEGRPSWERFFDDLRATGRAAMATVGPGRRLWIAAERLPQARAAWPAAAIDPAIAPPRRTPEPPDRATAVVEMLRGRLDLAGPVSAARLAADAGLEVADAMAALLRLEHEGFVFRGRFTPGSEGEEWCARRLLARIHRATLDRLRREIEPVSAADFMRFLLSWQRVTPADRASGPDGARAVLEILEGYEAPAGAWETEILPARLARYDPAWIDGLCRSGRFLWGRWSAPRPAPEGARAVVPVRSTPIAFVSRPALPDWIDLAALPGAANGLSAEARALIEAIDGRGASFFDDLAAATGLLRTQVEAALAELVARGLVTSDSLSGLRALLTPADKRASAARRAAGPTLESAGRWSRLRPGPPARRPEAPVARPDAASTAARALLRRYGVVVRRLLDHEGIVPPWRDLLAVYRRLEARGEIRGGRFVAGLAGEQFAAPGAVEELRAIRRRATPDACVCLSAADPLNLTGTILPGPRLPPVTANRILYRDGVPVAVREGGAVRYLEALDPAAAWQARGLLLRRPGAAPRSARAAGGTRPTPVTDV
jgi:ATP-dependent Lhr-like helicase